MLYSPRPMTTLTRLWRGELMLEHAFWHWAVLGGVIINVTTSALFLALVASDRPLLALIAGYAPSIPYNILVSVGVWRSAGHYGGDRRHADLARIITIIGMLVLSVT